MRGPWKAVLFLGRAACPAWPGETQTANLPPVDIKHLPVNTWVRLPGLQSGPVWYAPVYAPSRRQLLHWGLVEVEPRGNDVRAFDPAAGKWVPDYESDPKVGIGISLVRGEAPAAAP
jgi:hypothetical protein